MNKIFTLVATFLALAGGVNAQQTKSSITKNNTWNLAPEIMERWNYQPTTSTTQKATEKGGMINAKGEVIECPNDELHDRMMATDPLYRRGFIQAQETIYQLVQQELADKRNGKSRKNGNGQGTVLERMSAPCVSGPNANVLKIPVVVHVMHLPGTAIGTNENISDATIQAGIQHLNDAFRKVGVYANGPFFTNSGITNSDVEIEFCLARRDPAGNATNGINRIATNYSNLFYKDIVSGTTTQDNALKALSFWNSTNYMNVWLVNEICTNSPSTGCGVAGYAYLAGAHGTTYDGIVNEAAYWGSSTDNSKVHIHEVGHYLNLSHTFNDSDGTGPLTSCDNTNCLTQGDYVCDTPPDEGTTAYNCSSSQTANSCSTDADDVSPNNPFTSDVQDIYEAYMDYGYQSCQNTFTPQQKLRMRAALLGARASLLTSEGCTPVTADEAGITAVTKPNGNECASPVIPSVTVKNYGTANITALTISYQLDGGAIATYNWTGTIAPAASSNIALPSLAFGTGSHTFYAYISDLNGAGVDTYPDNDNFCVTFTNNPINTFPTCDNFDASGISNWTVQNPNNDLTWSNATGLACGHGTAAKLDFYSYNGSGQNDRLLSRTIDLTGMSSAELTFDVAYALYGAGYPDRLQVQISTDCGATFIATPYDKAGSTLSTTSTTSTWTPTDCANHWRNETVNLTPYVGQNIVVSFTTTNAFGNSLYLDNVCFNATPCLTANLAASSSTALVEGCTENGWTYYTTTAAPNISLFGINWDETACPANSTARAAAIVSLGVDATNPDQQSGLDRILALKHYWNIAGTQPACPVDIRFFYDPTDAAAIDATAAAWQTAQSAPNLFPLFWFKTDGVAYDPATHVTSTLITGGAYPLTNSNTTNLTIDGITYAQFDNVDRFSGGSGGAGAGAGSSALPLDLLSFKGEIVGKNNILHWATANEQNTSHFVIEQSPNGNSFTAIGNKVNAAGNSTTTRYYSFTDETPALKSYYRLRSVDIDGRITYSTTVLLERKKGSFGIVEIYPNPTTSELTVNYETQETTTIQFRLTDVLGRIISTHSTMAAAGLNQEKLDISSLPTGVYFMEIMKNNSDKIVRKIVKE